MGYGVFADCYPMRAVLGRRAIDVDDCDSGAFAGKSLRNGCADATATAGHDRYFIVECSHVVLFVCQVVEQFFELLNSTNLGMIKGLVVRTMRHENDGFRFARDIMAILMTIIDEKSDPELANKNGFFVLSKVDDRIADTVRPEPIASQTVDIIRMSHPTVGNKDGLVRATDALEFLPLCRRQERCQRAPELGIVRCRLHAVENHCWSQKGIRREVRIGHGCGIDAPGAGPLRK